MANNLSSVPERFSTFIRLDLVEKRHMLGERCRASGFPSALLPCNLPECSLYPPSLQLTTKAEIQRGGKWAEKNVLVSCSDGSLGCLAGEGGMRGVGEEEADLNSASLRCHPEGRDLICGRTGTSDQACCSDSRLQS